MRILPLALSGLLVACSGGVPRYTSQDLALLPCEAGASPIFFQPIEFRADGQLTYGQEQLDRIRERLTPETSDVVLFVHGWNKNPSLAEHDFSDFLCRLHGHIREVAKERGMWGESQKGQRLLVIGAFWPSTFRANAHDPFWLKPSSYFRMRDRADTIADTGLQELLMTVALGLRSRANLHFVGHSFGARMIVHGLRHISAAGRLPELISRAGIVNVVLLNGALASHDFTWLLENVRKATPGVAARFSLASASGLYNVHSFHDSANRHLFPLASLFSPDAAECAAGACGVPEFSTLCVDSAGYLRKPPSVETTRQPSRTDQLAAWNVDATRIVFDHSDIYKGRVARLVVELLLRADRSKFTGVAQGAERPAQERCAGVE